MAAPGLLASVGSGAGSRCEPLVHGGEPQGEVSLRERCDDFPFECFVLREGGGAVGGAKQDREGELGGAGAAVSPAKSIRGVWDDGKRFARIEPAAGEVDLAGAPVTLDHVEPGGELIAVSRTLFATCELDQELVERSGSAVIDESGDGHRLAGEKCRIAGSPLTHRLSGQWSRMGRLVDGRTIRLPGSDEDRVMRPPGSVCSERSLR